jgi:Domain of unknown function (DUF1772)
LQPIPERAVSGQSAWVFVELVNQITGFSIMSYDIGTFTVAAISVILSGLLAGQMLAIAIANRAARRLPETSWILRFQAENELFTKTMPPSLLLPMAGLICSAYLTVSTQRYMFFAAAALEAIVLWITMMVEVPINKQVESWKPGSAPSTWMAIRDRWLRFHWLRTVVGGCSFACGAIGLGFHP